MTPDRLTLSPDGYFDELVVHGASIHLERLDTGLLWLHVVAATGEEYRLELRADGEIDAVVLERPGET